MRSLTLISILLTLPFSLFCQTSSLFDTIFEGQEVGASLGHTFVEEEKWVIIYHSYSGLSAFAYKVMLEAEKSDYSIQLAYVDEDETELRFDSAKKYNQVILDYLRKSVNQDEKIESAGFGCAESSQNSFGIYSRYPLIEFEHDSLTLTESSKCIIDKFYLPLLSHPAYGDWKLTIISEAHILDSVLKLKRVKYLQEYLISKGISPASIKIDDAFISVHFMEDIHKIQAHLIGLDIERVK